MTEQEMCQCCSGFQLLLRAEVDVLLSNTAGLLRYVTCVGALSLCLAVKKVDWCFLLWSKTARLDRSLAG